MQNEALVEIKTKIFDDLLLARTPSIIDLLIACSESKVELGKISSGPGHFPYLGISLHQNDDYSMVLDGDDKPTRIATISLSRISRRELYSGLTSIEAKALAALNSTVGWPGITASPFCVVLASFH